MNEQVEAFKTLLHRAEDLLLEADKLELPAFNATEHDCDVEWLRITEEHIFRWSHVDYDIDGDGTIALHGLTNGWDDYSESGFVAYLQCLNCHKVWAVPEDLPWD